MSLEDEMKKYRLVTDDNYFNQSAIILRLNGIAFNTFNKILNNSFDEDLLEVFEYTSFKLKEKIPNIKFIYTYLGEINILLETWNKSEAECWFGNKIQKIASVATSLCSNYFNKAISDIIDKYSLEENYEKVKIWKSRLFKTTFECNIYKLPLTGVSNYFSWRYRKALNLSKSNFCRQFLTPTEMNGNKIQDNLDLCFKKYGASWTNLNDKQKQGFCLYKDKQTKTWNTITDLLTIKKFSILDL